MAPATPSSSPTAPGAGATASGDPASASSSSSSSSPSTAAVPDPQRNLSSYLLTLQSALQPLTQSAAHLPNHSDLAFHRSIDRKLIPKLDAEADRLLSSVSQLASWISAHPQAPNPPFVERTTTTTTSRSRSRNGVELQPEDISADVFARSIGDLIDHLLENADTCLDEYTGKIAPRRSKHSNPAAAAAARFTIGALPKSGPLPAKILNAPIPPPQRAFTTKPDNRAGIPWSRPLKLGKPHAKVALGWKPDGKDGAEGSGEGEGGEGAVRGVRRGMYCAEGDPRDNPYHYEIMHAEPPAFCYEAPQPVAPAALDAENPGASTEQSPFVWVDTADKLAVLLDHLLEDRVREIAIDLEHHNYRTYQGIVCLMQLSTRWGDWIIDTLSNEIREHSETLNRAFADPNKVKVLHGANHDVLWLQRDLGLYLVNLFDTYHATNVLNFSGHGLGYLMQRYCDFDADKRYQLADWRIRPLPKEMLYYARSDTHSLLFIYDSLRKELMAASGERGVREVFELSKNVATAVYAKEEWDEEGEGRDGWRALWRKWGREAAEGSEKRRKPEEMKKEERLVRRLHQWRDMVAREEDESPNYVLRAATLMMLASRAPTTVAAVVASFSPAVPALRKRAPELASVIQQEVEAWERDVKKREKRIQQGLEGMEEAAGDGAAGDVGEAISRDRMEVEEIIKDERPVSALSVAATTAQDDINPSLWTKMSDDTARSTTAATTTPGATSSLTSLLFGNDESSAAAAVKTPKPLTAAHGGPSLFNLATAGTDKAEAARGNHEKVSQITRGFVQEVAHVLATKKREASEEAGEHQEAEEEPSLAAPETIKFVSKDQRTTIPDPAKEDAKQQKQQQEKEEEEEEMVVVNTKAGKKAKWSKEKKRKRDEQLAAAAAAAADGASGSGSGSGEVKQEAERDDDATPSKKAKTASSSGGTGGKAREKVTETFDFDRAGALLEDTLSDKKNERKHKQKRSKSSSSAAAAGGGDEAPRREKVVKKKNELRNAARSATFAG
ncbi:exosome nuclease subunit [Thecaphora frezii]